MTENDPHLHLDAGRWMPGTLAGEEIGVHVLVCARLHNLHPLIPTNDNTHYTTDLHVNILRLRLSNLVTAEGQTGCQRNLEAQDGCHKQQSTTCVLPDFPSFKD